MKLCIRAHDLGVKGTEDIRRCLTELGLDGVQLVAYKSYPEVAYVPGGIKPEMAARIGQGLSGFDVPLLGAYFNPVHSLESKRENGEAVFADYLKNAAALGSNVVASETGSFNDDKWTYHPRNRTEEALQAVVATFSRLADVGQDYGTTVAMEGAAGHVCFSPDTLNRAQRMMDRKNLKVIFDLYNYMDGENQGDYMEILEHGLDLFAGRIHAFHMKDCLLQNGEKPRQVPFGSGDLDRAGILRRIKEYDKDAVLVLEGTVGDAIPQAAAEIKRIWECI